MDKLILFTEQQRMSKWMGIILVAMIILCLAISVLVLQSNNWNLAKHWWKLALFTGIPILVMTLIAAIKLETEITQEGIAITFFPFIPKAKQYPWSTISKAYVRNYQYGGWGLRGIGPEVAVTTSGKEGIQLEFENGYRLLIGTQQAAQVQKILEQLNY
jgi:hypothetical protein